MSTIPEWLHPLLHAVRNEVYRDNFSCSVIYDAFRMVQARLEAELAPPTPESIITDIMHADDAELEIRTRPDGAFIVRLEVFGGYFGLASDADLGKALMKARDRLEHARKVG